jgi:hypothetical protein
MGIGNLERVVQAFGEERDPSYARLFFESTPVTHEESQELLAGFGDDSSTYLWRVLAAREIMRLYRQDPAELERLEGLHARKNSAEEVLHPEAETRRLNSARELRDARAAGYLVELPDDPDRLHFEIGPQVGEVARRLGESPATYRALRPQALALLEYLAAAVEEASEGPLTVTSAARDARYQRALRRGNPEAARGYSLHTTGYSFDILRDYASREQALAFQFWLDRLQALNLIAWVREPRAIHVTVAEDALLGRE